VCFAALFGCARYSPVAPRASESPSARVRIERLTNIVQSFWLSARFERVVRGVRLKEAVIARATTAPCRFGWAAQRGSLVRVGRVTVDSDARELLPGDELLLVFGPEVGARLDQVVRLDLVLERAGREECVAIPLTGDAAELAWNREGKWSAELPMGGRGYTRPVGALVGDLDARVMVGHRLDDVRVFAGVGVGAGFCRQSTCPPEVVDAGTDEERRTPRVSATFPLSLGFQAMPWQFGYFAFGSALEYEAMFTRLETYSGKRSSWIHGVTLAPRLALTYPDPWAPGLPGGWNNGFVALEFTAGAAHAPSLGGDVGLRLGGRVWVSMPVD